MTSKIVNNCNIYYNESGIGEPLFFIHGLGSDSTDWKEQTELFSTEFRTVAIDLRGHGRSEKTGNKYTIDLFTDDVYKLMSELRIDSAHIVGLSLGGMIAFNLAVKYPEIVKSLTVVNSRPEYKLKSINQLFGGLYRLLLIQLFGMKVSAAHIAKQIFPKPEQAAIQKRFIEKWLLNDKRAYIKSLLAIAGWSIENDLHKIKCPVLIIASEHDYTSVDFKKKYAEKILNCELKNILDSYHAVTADQPEEFNKTLANFLNQKT